MEITVNETSAQISNVYINRISSVLPNAPIENADMETVLGMVGGKPSRAKSIILRSNKITSRHYGIDRETGEFNYTNASLAAEAVSGLFADKYDGGIELNEIDCLVASTSLPDQSLPNHGVMVHGELNNPPCEVISTSGICLCGVTALKYGYLNIKSGESEGTVVVASEMASNYMHANNFETENQKKVEQLDKKPELAFEKDFLRWMLSDGAGAVLLSNKPNTERVSLKIDWIETLSFANQLEPCMYAGAEKKQGKLIGSTRLTSQQREEESIAAVKQDVKLLNENIVKVSVEQALTKISRKRKISPNDFDYFLPHYSSGYFRERLYQGLVNINFEIPYDKWFTNLSSKGNTGSASIFIMLEELYNNGTFRRGDRILCYIPESGRFSSAFMQLTAV
ncbi:MAG: beta-ketoacyl-ACP synthase III [Kangiellaceae bacterium]